MRSPLMPLEEAWTQLQLAAQSHRIAEQEEVSTFDALGRMLAQSVVSGLNVPPEDNTSMDGYAVRVADIPLAGTVLPVSQRIPAGVVGQPLQAGTVARIFTGGQIPAGADAVVMQEGTQNVEGPDPQVRFLEVPQAGQWIRRQGEDVRAGAEVLAAGTRITPQAQGLAASVGAARLMVWRRPRVALFSTGDELVMPGEPLKPGAIYNSNRFTLRGLLEAAGCVVRDLGIVPDKLEATRAALRQAAEANDLILTSGGVSVGEEDHLKPAAMAEGRIDMWQMAIKPGKPLALGAIRRPNGLGETLLVGLPGNPVSSFVTCLIAVLPLLRGMQGGAVALPQALPLRADFAWPKPDKRREFLRVRINQRGGLELFANQSSGVLTSAVWGDGLLDNPPGQSISLGDEVRFLPFASLMST